MGDSPVSVRNLLNSNNNSSNNSNNNRSRRNRNRNRNRNRTRNNNLSRFPLNVTNVLGPTTRSRFLCDSSVSKEIFSGTPNLVHIKPFADKRGEGSFGYTISAEMKVNITTPSPSEITCIAALKVSKRGAQILQKGIPADMLTESSIYSRITNTKGLAKGMFIKLSTTETRIVMEHYVMNLTELMDALLAVGGMTEPLIRAIIFQVANGLAELHSLGILHKDLKLDNILVAHDGRLLITDYGLSVYHCVDPLKPREIYFKLTTPTIQPPETIDSDFVGPEFDIWSLGSTFSSLLVYPQYAFDFYAKNGWNPSNLRQNWMTAFQSTQTTSEHYERRIERIFSSRPAQSFSAASTNLLMRMLDLSPKRRPTAQAIVEDPWFAGLTLDEAVRTVRLQLGTLGVINKKTFKILNSTKAPRNNLQNTNLEKYFNILPNNTALFIPKIGVVTHFNKYIALTWIFFNLFQEIDYSFYVLLHTIELYERVTQTYTHVTPDMILLNSVTCFMIATKISPYTYDTDRIPPVEYIRSKLGKYSSVQIIKSEIEIISALHGDLFPLKNGFVNFFLNTYMKNIKLEQKLYRFMLGIFSYIFWDGRVGTLRDFFHTVDVAYVESGEIGQGIAGEEPNTKGPDSMSDKIISIISTNVKKFHATSIAARPGDVTSVERFVHIINSLNPYIIKNIFRLTDAGFLDKENPSRSLEESSQHTIIPL